MRGAVGGQEAGESRFPDDPPFDHVHHEECRADHTDVLAQAVYAGDREAGIAERRHHPRLALDRMGAREQGAGRFTAEDVGAGRRVEPVGRVGLAALELADGQRSDEIFDLGGHPAFERCGVEAEPLIDRAGAAIRFGPVHGPPSS